MTMWDFTHELLQQKLEKKGQKFPSGVLKASVQIFEFS